MERSAGTAPSFAMPDRKRPGWVWMAVVAALCTWAAEIVLMLILWPTTLTRLLPRTIASNDVFGWPWPVASPWSLAADVGQALLVGFLLAGLLRACVRSWSRGDARRLDMRVWPVALAYAIGAPASSTIPSFALVVVVARTIALRPLPASRWQPSRAVVATFAAGAALLLVASFSYQPLHPLLAAFPDRDNPLTSVDIGSASPDRPRELAFALQNDGLDAVTVRSARAIGPNASLAVVVANGRPLAGAVVSREGYLHGRVQLAKATCRTSSARAHVPHATIAAVEVRLQAFGIPRTQRFAVSPAADLSCR